MAKFREKILARKLRKHGQSIKNIAKIIGVSQSSVSLWCNDISLSDQQKENLLENNLSKIKKGSIVASKNKKKERLNRVNFYKSLGINKVGKLSSRELFLVGAALYWAEGDKKQRRVVFINSDPEMILIFILWLEKCLNIPKDRLMCRLEINEIHKQRLNDIEKYWSNLTNISKSQFRIPSFKKTKINKIYENNLNYYGSLQITVSKGTNLNYEILGYIKGLAKSSNMVK